MKLNTSILQLKKLQVEQFKLEENINGINKFILDADFILVESAEGDNNEKYREFHFTLKVNDRAKNPALKSKIEIAVLFDVDKNLPEEKQVSFILYNGLAIIYGIIRGMIFQACSILPPNMRLLPSVNLADFINSKLQELTEDKNN